MSDFEERLSAVLAGEAEDAPRGEGLAEAARGRYVVRRRRRLAVGVVGAALAIAVPVAALTGAGGDGAGDELVGDDPTTAAPSGQWRTIEEEGVRVEVPAEWERFRCDFDGFAHDVYGPSEADACDFGTYLAFYGSATFDPAHGPGVITGGSDDGASAWSGYVYAGDLAVTSSTDDRDRTRRILASARLVGQPDIAAERWRTAEGLGIRFEVPRFWGLGSEADLTPYAVCVTPGDKDDPPQLEPEGDVREVGLGLSYLSGRWVSVSAPTQAVGDLVMATVEATSGAAVVGCLPLDFGG